MKKISFIATSVLVGLLVWIPLRASALNFIVETPQDIVRAGDTVLVKIRIDTGDKEINALEGELRVSGPAKIKSVSTAGSIFSLWPTRPSINNNVISFAGGSPSSTFGRDLNLFTILLSLTDSGPVTIESSNLIGYLADGKGTSFSGTVSSYKIQVGARGATSRDDLALLILTDKIPPLPFIIDLGRDPALYDGKYFLTFHTEDTESGIDRYEVREGDLPSVRSGNTYVLQDQRLRHKVEVKAVDIAGNARIQVLDLQKTPSLATRIIIILIITILTIIVIKRIRSRSR